MFQCDEDEDRETIESGDKRFAFEDKSNADVCKATDTSNLKELLLLRKDLLPVLRDGENNNGGENASLGENHGDEGDVDNLSLWNAAPNDHNFNSSISAQGAGEQSSLMSGQGGNGFQDVGELSENRGELAENPPEARKTSEDSAAIVGVSDENKNLAYNETDIKKTRQFNLPYEGIKNSQIQRYSNHIEYSSSYISSSSDNEHSSTYKAETVTHIAGETCCEENGFGNEDLVLAETDQQLPKGSSGLARGVSAEDGGMFDLVSGSGISMEPSASHNLNADTEENGLKMKQERNLLGKDKGYEEKDVMSTNDAVDLKKLPKDVEKLSTEIRDQVTQMDDVCQKQIEDLTLTQSGGSCSSLSELQTVNANVRNESSDVKCTKILDSKAHFSTEVVRESNELEKETLVSDCSEDKKLDTDALVKIIGPDSEGASLDDTTDHDSDKSPSVPVGMTIACHLPSLEDGLSSGHASDSDEMASSCQAQASGDALYLPLTTEVQDRPALLASSQQSRDTKEGSHASVNLVSDTRQRDVYLAIQDIRSAIEKSKTVKLISPSVGDEEKSKEADDYRSVEPVWITRKEQATDLQKQTPKNQNKPSSTSPELGNNHKRPQNITHKHNRQYSAVPAADSDQDYDSDSPTDPRNKTRNASSRHLSDSSMASDRVKNVTSVDGKMGSIAQRPILDLTERSEPPIEANSRHSEQPEGSEESATDISVAQSQADEPQKKAKRPDDRNLEEYSEKAQIRSVEGGGEYSTDDETDELLNKQYVQNEKIDIPELSTSLANQSQDERQKSHARKVALRDPTNETVLMEGVLFRASYLGSTQLTSEGQPSKRMRMVQAQEAVSRIKAPEGETQPSTEVELFVSAEKIMVLNTDLQEIMMDHALRTISYIADIGEILVVMARRGPTAASAADKSSAQRRSQTKLCCHVFESDEAQFIAQSIGRAFQASYVEFLKANGIDNPTHIQDLDYQEVLNQQEIFSEELSLFSNREMQKEITVSKAKGEPLGVVIVESGWGSLLPTVVLANMSPVGAAARCGQLNIGDQIMSIDGVSLVGLPLAKCQNHIKSARSQLVVRLAVVSCPPVVEVLIKRPDVKYQLGFSVQDGVICSLLRGGIAERGGVRVGHRIIEINGRSVVAVSHETIVELLAASVGEIQMKTMPTSIFQLLTGQDVPHYI